MEEVEELTTLPVTLPNELIIKILKFAHPSVIISISSSSDIYLKSFTFVPELLRDCHFCERTFIPVGSLREFLKSAKRRKEIENLCVRGYETLGCVLFNTSFPWSRLKKLDISHCGVNVTGLFSMLNHLEQLEELSWSTFFSNNDEPQRYFPYPSLKRQKVESIFTDFEIKNLKTLNLEVVCANIANVLVLLVLFKDITNLRIRVTHCLTRRCVNACLSALDSVDLKSLEKNCENGEARFENLREFSLTSDSHQRWGRNFPIITHVRCVCSTIHCFVKYKLKEPTALEKILIVIQKELNQSDLDWITRSTSLPLINVQSKEINYPLVNWINYHGGAKLRYLALSNCYSEFKKLKCLPLIFESCPNIEELNLDGYFDTDSKHENCQSIAKLNKLKALAISDVLLNREIREPSSSKQSETKSPETKLFTSSVRTSRLETNENEEGSSKFKLNHFSGLKNNLEELEIRSVINSSRSANLLDVDLMPISSFERLTRLTLSHLSGVIRGQCFWPIFSKCPNLRSLRIYHLEFNNSGVCQHQDAFVNSLSLLSVNLQTLSFHHSQLDLTKVNLWHCLGELEQLKELCLGTNKNDTLELKPIASFLNRAKNLRVIHIHSKSKNFKQIERLVKKHHCFANKPNAEIVIHELIAEQSVVKVTEWSPFQSSVENKKNLCWGSSEIGYYETRSRCHR